jgi:serine/threonine protein kinase
MDDTETHRREMGAVEVLCRPDRDHPNVIRVWDARIWGGNEHSVAKITILMDLFKGTLDRLLQGVKDKGKFLSMTSIFECAIAILEGLRYCHHHNYIHRDLTPRNGIPSIILHLLTAVLYSREPRQTNSPQRRHFVLSDFGFSKPFDGQESSGRSGSDGYRAPELTAPETRGQYSDKTDIWAFGCVLMELASTKRRKAFDNDWAARMYAQGSSQYPLPQLESVENPALEQPALDFFNEVLTLCFKPKPEDRPSAHILLSIFNVRGFDILNNT